MINLRDLICNFEDLNRYNDSALETLVNISNGFFEGESDDQHTGSLDELFRDINRMINNIHLPSKSDFYEGLTSKEYVEKLKDKVTKSYDQSLRDLSLGRQFEQMNCRDFSRSPNIQKELAKRTYKKLQTLNPKLEGDFSAGEITLDELVTPHDFVRYIHRVGTELFFENGDSKWSMCGVNLERIFKKRFSINLISADNSNSVSEVLKTNPVLKRIDEVTSSDKFDTKLTACDDLNILVGKNNLTIQMPLGCHYSTILIKTTYDQRGNARYDLSFKFVNTDNEPTSYFRSNFCDVVLKVLEYDVSRHHHRFNASKSFDSQTDLVEEIEELLRFSISLKDLDIIKASGNINDRLDDTVSAYFAGVIDLFSYVKTYNTRPDYIQRAILDDVLRFHGPFQLAEEEIDEAELERFEEGEKGIKISSLAENKIGKNDQLILDKEVVNPKPISSVGVYQTNYSHWEKMVPYGNDYFHIKPEEYHKSQFGEIDSSFEEGPFVLKPTVLKPTLGNEYLREIGSKQTYEHGEFMEAQQGCGNLDLNLDLEAVKKLIEGFKKYFGGEKFYFSHSKPHQK